MIALTGPWSRIRTDLALRLATARPVDTGQWQSQDISDKPEMLSYELENVVIDIPVDEFPGDWRKTIQPNMPWAEDHFQERISGEPLNPPPSEAWWPYAVQGNAEHKAGKKFSHTYPERMWPKRAGIGTIYNNVEPDNRGIRFAYGDLDDVIDLLIKSPQTRQAYLPIWFPEDTGAAHGERVPCSLGYHFLARNGTVNVTYHIRSCDFMRHFTDDVYMAGRLLQFVAGASNSGIPGRLIMHIGSLHIFEGDRTNIKTLARTYADLDGQRLGSAFL